MNNDEKKNPKAGNEAFSKFLNKSADISKKIAKNAYEGTKSAVEKMKENSEQRQKEKLSPVFPKDYKSKNFYLPNIIQIVDDAVRREIALCDGAIGWREQVNGVEILFLYDEAREISHLNFIPTFTCNSIYCVDPFDRTRFIKADCIFSKAQEEKLAELEHIAFCLGAKSCSIEIVSSEAFEETKMRKFSASALKSSVSTEQQTQIKLGNQSSGKTEVHFEGHDHPTEPKLKWFTYDDTIKNLIEMRCNHPSSIKTRLLELSGSSSSTMSQQTAMAIDCLLKKAKIKASAKMEDMSSKELSSKLLFHIEF